MTRATASRSRSGRGLILRRQGREWVTAASAVALLGEDVTADMVYDWARRGMVVKISDGRTALYSWPQVRDTEARTRLSRAGRKRVVGEAAAAGVAPTACLRRPSAA